VFDNERFRCLAGPSKGHLHNLRRSPACVREMGGRYGRCLARLMIAELRRPPPEGLPGYLLVDSVHPGDLDQGKGVYHIQAWDGSLLFDSIGQLQMPESAAFSCHSRLERRTHMASTSQSSRNGVPLEVATVGLELTKTTVHFVGLDATGQLLTRRQHSKGTLLEVNSKVRSCRIGMGAGYGIHHLGR